VLEGELMAVSQEVSLRPAGVEGMGIVDMMQWRK